MGVVFIDLSTVLEASLAQFQVEMNIREKHGVPRCKKNARITKSIDLSAIKFSEMDSTLNFLSIVYKTYF